MTILELLQQIPDPRVEGKVKHKLGSVLFVGLCGVLSGCEKWSDIEDYCTAKREWLLRYVDLSGGVPSMWTFRRIFTLQDPAFLEKSLSAYAEFVMSESGQDSDHIAIDGKALRGSKREDLKCLQSISAWCHANHLVLGECQVDGKSNEITAIPLLLEALDLKGETVTIDAMGCQKAIAEQIIAKKGDYVFGLKSNQKKLFEAALSLTSKEGEHVKNRLHDAFEDGHGKLTRRRYFGYDAQKLPGIEAWAGAKSVIAVETICKKINDPAHKTNAQYRYYLSSHSHKNGEIPGFIRHHWGIENKLHWVLDVHFKEDDDQKSERKSARSFALLRRIALNIVRTRDLTPKRSVRRKLKRSGWDNDYLAGLLTAV